jgi:addiction module HigA family antidote
MMYNPPHPGELLRLELLDELGLTVTEAAARLAMTRAPLSRVLNGRAAISADLAIRLEVLGISTAKTWLDMQTNYNLFQARQRSGSQLGQLGALKSVEVPQ